MVKMLFVIVGGAGVEPANKFLKYIACAGRHAHAALLPFAAFASRVPAMYIWYRFVMAGCLT